MMHSSNDKKAKKSFLLSLLLCAWLLSAQEYIHSIGEEGDFAFGSVSLVGDIKPCDTGVGKGFLAGANGQNGYVRLQLSELHGEKLFFSFWVSPVNWTPADGKFYIFTHARATDQSGEFNLYRYGNPDPSSDGLGIAYNQTSSRTDPQQVVINVPNDRILWQKNSWHYFVIASSDEHIAFYLDGELAGMQKIPFGIDGAAEFRFGSSWGAPGMTRLADIRMGSQVPSAEEVAEEYDQVMMNLEEKQ